MDLARIASLPLTARVVASREHVACDLGGESVILQTRTGVYHSLNDVGSFLWKRLQEPRTLAELMNFLTEEYEVTPARCETDLRRLLAEMAKAGLVEVST